SVARRVALRLRDRHAVRHAVLEIASRDSAVRRGKHWGALDMIDPPQLLHGTLAMAALAPTGPAAAHGPDSPRADTEKATAAGAASGPAAARVTDAPRAEMAKATAAFLAALSSGQTRAAVFPFAGDERKNWHYVPRSRSGVTFKEMSAGARAAAHDLLKVSL